MIYDAEILDTRLSITDHQLQVIELPFHAPVHLPFGTIETRPSAWLQVAGEANGQAGNGAAEGTALPMQIPLYDDYSGNLGSNIDRLMDGLRGRELTLDEAKSTIADTDLGGNFATARMTVEASLLDLICRSGGISVYEALSGEHPDGPLAIPYGKSIGETEYDNIVRAGLAAADNGARRLKFKLSPANHQAVADGLSYLQSRLPEADLMVDANGSFDPEDPGHRLMLSAIDALGLMMIEEPVSRGGRLRGLDAHRALRSLVELATPIALDDSISTQTDARVALDQGLGDIINLKPGRVGSFLDCLDIAELAERRGKQIMVGGMFEATPGRMMTLTLAALCLRRGFNIPGDVSLPQERLARDLPPPERLRLDQDHNVVFEPQAGWGYSL